MQYKHFKLFMIKEEAKDFLSTYIPIPFIHIMKLKYRLNGERDRTVTKETDLVLEGYPRSANSFMSKIFDKNSELKLSDHTHYSANVILGVLRKKPTLVLIRRPEDAVISYVSLFIQSQIRDFGYDMQDIKENDIARLIRFSIKKYIRYYSKLVKFGPIIFLTFDDVTNNLNLVVSHINKNCQLNPPIQIEEGAGQKVLKDKKAYHLGPSEERNLIKKKVENVYLNSSEKISEANRIYEKILENSSLSGQK